MLQLLQIGCLVFRCVPLARVKQLVELIGVCILKFMVLDIRISRSYFRDFVAKT
jgi:hypothetical protein